jgi:hypothetical protein
MLWAARGNPSATTRGEMNGSASAPARTISRSPAMSLAAVSGGGKRRRAAIAETRATGTLPASGLKGETAGLAGRVFTEEAPVPDRPDQFMHEADTRRELGRIAQAVEAKREFVGETHVVVAGTVGDVLILATGKNLNERADWYGRASKHVGRSMKRTLQRRQPTPTEVSVGCKEDPTRSIVVEGQGLGEEAGTSTQVTSRPTGGGTCARIVDPKQGTSRWRPPGKDRRYNRKPGKAKELSRGTDRVVVATRRVGNKTTAEPRTVG